MRTSKINIISGNTLSLEPNWKSVVWGDGICHNTGLFSYQQAIPF